MSRLHCSEPKGSPVPREVHTVWAWMCIPSGTCLCTCVHMFRHTCGPVCIRQVMCIQVCTRVFYTCVCIHSRVRTYVEYMCHTCMWTCSYVCAHTDYCAYTYMYTCAVGLRMHWCVCLQVCNRQGFFFQHLLARSNTGSGHCLCCALLGWGSGCLKVLRVNWGGPGTGPSRWTQPFKEDVG